VNTTAHTSALPSPPIFPSFFFSTELVVTALLFWFLRFAELPLGEHDCSYSALPSPPLFPSFSLLSLPCCSGFCGLQSCYWVNETARKEMLVRWCEAFSRALLVHCRCGSDNLTY
jgi:hypothetical protein